MSEFEETFGAETPAPKKKKKSKPVTATEHVEEKPIVTDTWTHKDMAPNLLDVRNKQLNMHYRYVKLADVERRKRMGYVVVEGDAKEEAGMHAGSVRGTHDMVLMKTPLENAAKIQAYHEERARKRVEAFKDVKSTKEHFKQQLRRQRVGDTLIDGVTTED